MTGIAVGRMGNKDSHSRSDHGGRQTSVFIARNLPRSIWLKFVQQMGQA